KPIIVATPSTTWDPQQAKSPPSIAKSPAIKRAMKLVERIARSPIPVLVRGETGVGKEVMARLLHELGPRKNMPLRAVNCGAIPSQLVESLLFGHEKGAFTGAISRQKGVFETANKGTLLLDEIAELPLSTQATLLRVLENRTVGRIGSSDEIEVDVR